MGYADKLTAAPGHAVEFKVSAAPGPYQVTPTLCDASLVSPPWATLYTDSFADLL